LDVEKIPWMAWAMLLGPEALMKAPKAVWQALFDMAEGNPAPLLGAGASTCSASMRDGTVVKAELLLPKERMAQEYGEGDESPGLEPAYDEFEIGTQEGKPELKAYLSASIMGALFKEEVALLKLESANLKLAQT
jgi:hypothetical protein